MDLLSSERTQFFLKTWPLPIRGACVRACVRVISSSNCTTESTSHSVCENDSQKYPVRADITVAFSSVSSTIDGGDVGVSPGTAITAVETIAHKGGIITTESTAFATHVISVHTAALATSPSSTAAIPEIGGRTFPP
jgi:hypothetical protein